MYVRKNEVVVFRERERKSERERESARERVFVDVRERGAEDGRVSCESRAERDGAWRRRMVQMCGMGQER